MVLRLGGPVEIFADPQEGGDVSLHHDLSTALCSISGVGLGWLRICCLL